MNPLLMIVALCLLGWLLTIFVFVDGEWRYMALAVAAVATVLLIGGL